MLPLKPFKFQNAIRKWRDTQNGKRKWKGIIYLIKSLQLGWEVVVVDYCDSSFFGVRYKAVLSEDRPGCRQNHVKASFWGVLFLSYIYLVWTVRISRVEAYKTELVGKSVIYVFTLWLP